MGVMARATVLALLKALMILVFAGWVALWILKPTEMWTRKWKGAEDSTHGTVFGYYGLNFAVYAFPIIALAIIGSLYLNDTASGTISSRQRKTSLSALSYPIIANSLLGILSVMEILGILAFVIFLAWTFYCRISQDLEKLMPVKSLKLSIWQLKYLRVATRFGLLAEACLALLLLPILRVTPVLRLLGIQFEAAVRYHTWLGTAMILFATFHGASTLFIWGVGHVIQDEVWKWQKTGRIYLAGEIALVLGLVIWITSLPFIRRKQFEIFYYTHHLYTLFILFYLFHAGDRHFYMVFPGIFLFGLDKLLRIIQSRPRTYLLSAKVLPCEAIELTLPKDPKLKYSPTSVVFMNVPRISKLQWHAFSITSSSNVQEDTLSLMIKCEGWWTSTLCRMITEELNSDTHLTKCIPVAIEGPYGPSTVDFLRYDSMLLIAGGSGITPFLSILQEIVLAKGSSRYKFPERIQLIHVVKRSQDMSLLSSISLILRNQSLKKLHLKLKVYVTREEQPDAAARVLQDALSQGQIVHFDAKATSYAIHGFDRPTVIAAILGIASILFFVLLICFNRIFVPAEKKTGTLKPKGADSKTKTPSSVVDLILLSCFAISVIVSMTVALMLRWRRIKKAVPPTSPKKAVGFTEPSLTDPCDPLQEHEVHYGGRPNFQDIFAKFPNEARGSDIGVLVCGPESMKESVAKALQQTGQGCGAKTRSKFTFHSLNFTL
ncbi:hypothetical protein BT93_K0252 [Corymbia citriodora subsp. variegata]|nr:hypothetical protein BT93_K0252 [Corymbia citriodora subsp. variegata]